jgi:hypothetical protein
MGTRWKKKEGRMGGKKGGREGGRGRARRRGDSGEGNDVEGRLACVP